ncbi:hypothetical protein FCK90_03095 [Kocuria coralli]|uniref:Uncharacterized protein n=1 Tax=Kocuria coralli TaxID=1461025 RepID=A0A5J5L181_9MICC|nr:hypothetical protein [Kocuria coralli]KAA9395400.1 hypothetical protein FCK90_03095 [Kocuria coralli]
MHSASTPFAAVSRRWPAAIAVVVLSWGLAGCGSGTSADVGGGGETTGLATPPDRESAEPVMAEGAEMPVWGYSASCDQPRPEGEDDGLVRPDPLAGDENTQFYVPAVEEMLCNINDVRSASVAGQYTDSDGVRNGSVDVGVVMSADSSEEALRAVRQAAVTAADEQQLPAQGIEVETIEIFLADGSSVSGPAHAVGDDGSETMTGEAIRSLVLLREAGAGTYWSAVAGEDLTLTTYLTADVLAADYGQSREEAMSASTGVQAEVPPEVRQDLVVVEDGPLTLTYRSDLPADLSEAVLGDLVELSAIEDVESVAAQLSTDPEGREVLRVRTNAANPATAPDVDDAVADLQRSVSAHGLQLDHAVTGAPAPTRS